MFEKLGYKPTPEQKEIHDDPARIKLVTGGERAGKSKLSAMELMSQFFEGSLYWLVGANYGETRAEYDYICDGFDSLGWEYVATKHIDPGEIIVAGGFRVATKSALDPRKLGKEAPDGILVCEGGQLDYFSYLRLRGRIAEKRAWMLMTGTLEGSLGWYPESFKRWQAPNEDDARSFSLPSWTNTYIYPGGRTDPEILALERGCSKDWFQERYAGKPVKIQGLVFLEFSNAIHTGVGKEFEFDPSLNVYIFCDPGFATASVVLATQKRGEHLYVVDEIYERGLVTSDIIAIAKQKPWFNKVAGGAIDIAALQHQSMPAVSSIWQKETGIHLRSQKVRIQDGIEAVKRFLGVSPITNSPLLHINAKCVGLLSEMGACCNPIDKKVAAYKWRLDKAGNVIGEVPDDKNNHACKALAYGIIDLFGYSPAMRKAKIKFF